MKRESVENGTFPLNESKAADEGRFALERERESIENEIFPLKESKAADEELFARIGSSYIAKTMFSVDVRPAAWDQV